MPIASANSGLSSTFSISTGFATAQGTVTITNPGRAFRILGVTGSGTAASVITVRKNTGGGDTAAVVTTDVTDEPMWGELDPANLEFTATDNVHITVATQNATQVDILCVESFAGTALLTAVT